MVFRRKFNQPEKTVHKFKETPTSPSSHDDSNWLVSYADMMTLLCGFFIMLFSMCKLDNPQYDSFKEALAKQFGGEYVSSTKELAKFATQILQELGLEKTVIVKTDAYGISLVFESTIFFNTLSADVTQQGKEILEKLINSIGEREASTDKIYKIVVEGHTDSRPIVGGIYPSNWELSGARAARVVRMFLARGFSPDHLTAIGYADTRPVVDSRTSKGTYDEKALAQNRRVVLRILEPSTDLDQSLSQIPPPVSPPSQTENPTKTQPAASTPSPMSNAKPVTPKSAS